MTLLEAIQPYSKILEGSSRTADVNKKKQEAWKATEQIRAIVGENSTKGGDGFRKLHLLR